MKHLVLITTSFPMTNCGNEAAGSFVYDMAVTLADAVKVTVVAPGSETIREKTGSFVSVQRFQAPSQPLSLLKLNNPLHWVPILQTLRSGQCAVNSVVEQEHVDHLLALWTLPSGYWAKTAAKRHQIPYSTWALGSDIWSLGKLPVVRNILRQVLQLSFANYADGYELKKSVETISERNCFFLPSARQIGSHKEKILSAHPPYRLAFLGRWHVNKGVDILLQSLSCLSNNDWNLIEEIRIFGGGPLHDYVHEKVGNLKGKGRPVTIGKFIEKNESVSLFLWADYVLIPSRIESIPLVFSDAMKCRCPVVSNPVGDLKRLVGENNVGVLSENCSYEAFSNALKEIIKKAPCEYSKNIDDVAEMFDLGKISDNLVKNCFGGD